jgi:hypothetical protein
MAKDSTKTGANAGTVAAEERRRFARYSCVANAEVKDMKPPHVRIKARISDLGREGCYVDTISPFAVGTSVLIRVMKNDQAFSAKAIVLYATFGMGMGLKFTSVPPDEVPVLEKWLAELSGEAPTEESEATITGQAHDHGQEQSGLRGLFSELIAALVRKHMLTEAEGKAMLDKLSGNQNLF